MIIDEKLIRFAAGMRRAMIVTHDDDTKLFRVLSTFLSMVEWPHVLITNIVTAAGHARAYYLGERACTCDQGPSGHEWWAGCGVPPEAIEGHVWESEPHPFTPGDVAAPAMRLYYHDSPGVACMLCGEREGNYNHHRCPNCFADVREAGAEHHCDLVDGCECTLCTARRAFVRSGPDEFAEPVSLLDEMLVSLAQIPDAVDGNVELSQAVVDALMSNDD